MGSVAAKSWENCRINLFKGMLGQAAVKWEQVMRSCLGKAMFDVIEVSDLGITQNHRISRHKTEFNFSCLLPVVRAPGPVGVPHAGLSGQDLAARPVPLGAWHWRSHRSMHLTVNRVRPRLGQDMGTGVSGTHGQAGQGRAGLWGAGARPCCSLSGLMWGPESGKSGGNPKGPGQDF